MEPSEVDRSDIISVVELEHSGSWKMPEFMPVNRYLGVGWVLLETLVRYRGSEHEVPVYVMGWPRASGEQPEEPPTRHVDVRFGGAE